MKLITRVSSKIIDFVPNKETVSFRITEDAIKNGKLEDVTGLRGEVLKKALFG